MNVDLNPGHGNPARPLQKKAAFARLLFGVTPFLALTGGLRSESEKPFSAQSGPGHTALIELYSSEGCSSCPPAEKWVGSLVNESGLWRQFVPVAFHVDYWDNLGWRDRFATERNTKRQQNYADAWHNRSVYTPGFVLDGSEWQGRALPDFGSAAKQDSGILVLRSEATNHFAVTFQPPAGSHERWDATVAWLGIDLSTQVRRGENAGKSLRHSFVVLDWRTAPLETATNGPSATLDLPRPATSEPVGRFAVAAWVSKHGTQAPVQAVGAWWKE